MKKLFISCVALLSVCLSAVAQETAEETKAKVEVNAGADLVSGYLWRGQHLSGAAFQPTLGFGVGGFSLAAWGSIDFKNEAHEFDWVAAYSFDKIGLSIAVTDYYGLFHGKNAADGNIWDGDVLVKYGNYDNHILEGTVGYDFSAVCNKFALTLAVNVNMVNDDDHSTYIELGYPVKTDLVNLDFAVGLTPAEGAYSDNFNIVNISIKGTKELEFSPKFSLPVFAQAVLNPNKEQCSIIFGASF